MAAAAALAWAAPPSVAQAPRSNQWLADCKGESGSACGVSVLVDPGRATPDLFLISVAVGTGALSIYSPTGAQVTQLRVDNKPSVGVDHCVRGTCTMPASRSGDFLAEMLQGGRLTVEFKPQGDGILLPLVVSLDGFAARYAEAQNRQASR